MNDKGNLIVISGPSGVGKGTVCDILLKSCKNLALSISATTRAPRDIDAEGVTYYFKTKQEFENMIKQNKFLEWAKYNDNYYGTPLEPVREKLKQGTNVLLEIDVQGALNVKKICPDAVYIFIAPPDIETLHKRLNNRGTETQEEIKRRIDSADAELMQQDKYDYVVINDNLDDAVREIENIINGN